MEKKFSVHFRLIPAIATAIPTDIRLNEDLWGPPGAVQTSNCAGSLGVSTIVQADASR